MTNKRKIKLLEIRIKQLEEENEILIKNSSEEIKNQIELFENARNEYNKLNEQMYSLLNDMKMAKKLLDKKEMKANISFIKKLNRKINKI